MKKMKKTELIQHISEVVMNYEKFENIGVFYGTICALPIN